MKKLIISILVILGFIIPTNIQGEIIYKDGKFVQVNNKREKKQDPQTQYPYTKDGVDYPTYISSNGRVYAIVVSKKSGKPYKVYMPEEDSKRIAKEMGIHFIEKPEPFK